MNRKTVVISIIVILSILLGVLVGFYFYIKNQGSEGPIDSNNQNVSFFGTSSPTNISVPNISGQNNSPTQAPATSTSYFTPAIWRLIWDRPVSTFNFVYKDIKSTTTANKARVLTEETIRFSDRETGNILQTSTSTILIDRISNTTFPRVEEGFFAGASGNSIIMRRLTQKGDEIETILGTLQTLTTTSTSQSLITKTLPKDLLFVTHSPDKTLTAYITNDPNERLITTKLDGSGKVVVWTSPLKEFIPYWVSKDSIILHSKASAFASSYIYSVNPATKAIRKLPLGTANRQGFTATVRSDLKKAIISYLDNTGHIVTAIRNIDSSDEFPLYVSTLSEKCIWSKKNIDIILCAVPETDIQGSYPDIWYQGKVTLQDNLWQIDTRTGEARLIFRPFDYITSGLDMQKLELNKLEDYLIFQDKRTLTLWGLKTSIPLATSTRGVR